MISFQGMGRFSLIVAALTALLAFAGCGMGIPLIPGAPTPGVQNQQPMKTWPATPEPSATSWTPEPPVQYTPEPTPTETTAGPTVNNVASFEHFTVTVQATSGRETDFWVKAEVCVVKAVNSSGTMITVAPWSVTTNDGKVRKADKHPEWNEADFPLTGKYGVGECAAGWINFKDIDGMNIREIGYANSLNDQALWSDGGNRI